ncbi:MAG: hypothetical protein HOO92_12905 [Methylococcaceae bacterium]|nr:hypothetical protein [Methylococcaceae bacterium]
MNAFSLAPSPLYPRIEDNLSDQIVDVFYEKLLDDYAVYRLFSGKSIAEQTAPLKVYLKAKFAGLNNSNREAELLDEYFMAAFARSSVKSTPMASDFDFLMEIAGGKDTRVLTYLCDAHTHFLKFKPDDFHYDVLMKHLSDTLTELSIEEGLQHDLMELAESARNPVLGRQSE